jgi:hypothetical protein
VLAPPSPSSGDELPWRLDAWAREIEAAARAALAEGEP